MKTRMAVKFVSITALIVFGLITVGLSGQPNKNTKRVEWVDENGKTHITITSGSPSQPAVPAPQTTAPAPGASQPMPKMISAKVIKVESPDTFVIEGGRKVKYVGLVAPTDKDPNFKDSLEFHRKVVEGKFVNIRFDSQQTAQDGTLLGFVFINQLTFVNADLIRFGYAHAKSDPPNTKYQLLFSSLEERAKSRKLGIWKN